MDSIDLIAAHLHCTANFDEVIASEVCGCFFCVATYRADKVDNWLTESTGNQTATCPRCGVDSVIGDASGLEITEAFLLAMKDRWFGSGG